MSVTLSASILNGTYTATVEGATVMEAMKELAFFSAWPDLCPICQSTMGITHRKIEPKAGKQGGEYFGLKCKGPVPHERDFHMHMDRQSLYTVDDEEFQVEYKLRTQQSEGGGSWNQGQGQPAQTQAPQQSAPVQQQAPQQQQPSFEQAMGAPTGQPQMANSTDRPRTDRQMELIRDQCLRVNLNPVSAIFNQFGFKPGEAQNPDGSKRVLTEREAIQLLNSLGGLPTANPAQMNPNDVF